jgi:hypothetical protein
MNIPMLAALPLAATAYVAADGPMLIHIVNIDTFRAICGDVKPESILHDTSVARNPAAATCAKCRAKYERAVGPLKKVAV